MSYDVWKTTPPGDEEPDVEACGHRVGTCEGECRRADTEPAPALEEESEMTDREVMACPFCCAGVYAGESYDALLADVRALWAYRVLHCHGSRLGMWSNESDLVSSAKAVFPSLEAKLRDELGECP